MTTWKILTSERFWIIFYNMTRTLDGALRTYSSVSSLKILDILYLKKLPLQW